MFLELPQQPPAENVPPIKKSRFKLSQERATAKKKSTDTTDDPEEMIDSKLINRGSYMSAHVLLNLLNELGKRDKMRGLPSILSLFRNKFNKFNNT